VVAEFCVICAAPRSGTTLLAEALERAYDLASPSEVFHEAHANPTVELANVRHAVQRSNFFRFRTNCIRERPELLSPDYAARQELFDTYLDHLRKVFEKDRFLIDVKYNSWHHLDGFWRFPTDPPGLIRLLRERKITVVHLVRENLFALYCSLRMAELTDV
jgi:hypothetical protein